jgi:hypothetical protein
MPRQRVDRKAVRLSNPGFNKKKHKFDGMIITNKPRRLWKKIRRKMARQSRHFNLSRG